MGMKKIAALVFAYVLFIILAIVIIMQVNPLLKSPERIRSDMLKLTPLHSSMDEVLEVIYSKEKWEIKRVNYDNGYVNYDILIPNTDPRYPLEYDHLVVGEQSIRAYLGKTWTFGQSVTVSWGFDENSRLIDVYVSKYLAI